MRFPTAIFAILVATSAQTVFSSEVIAPPPDGEVARLKPWFETNVLATLAKKMNPRQDVEIELWVAWGGKLEEVQIFEKGARGPIPDLTESDRNTALQAIGELGAEEFWKREEAAKALRMMGRKVLPLLREAASDSNQDLEIRARSKQAINHAEHVLIQPDAVEYLKEQVVSDEACFNRRFVLTFKKEELDKIIPPPSPEREYPLWDGKESMVSYALRVGLPAQRTVELGHGVKMEFVLIPAVKFLMGTPMPEPPSETPLTGQTMLGSCVALLMLLVFFAVLRGLRKRRWPQFSLSYMLVMLFIASMVLWGGVRWRQALEAQTQYYREVGEYKNVADNEKPAHYVTLKKPYYLGKYEVTVEQYQSIMGVPERKDELLGSTLDVKKIVENNPNLPVSGIRHRLGVFLFCKKLRDKCKALFRLPTEAEWEFACKARTQARTCSEDAGSDLDSCGWYLENSLQTINSNTIPQSIKSMLHSNNDTYKRSARRWVADNLKAQPVGIKASNAFGLYDMRGNVWELCQSVYAPYSKENEVDLQEPNPYFNQPFAIRGGSAKSSAKDCRSTNRTSTDDSSTGPLVGMRIVMDVE